MDDEALILFVQEYKELYDSSDPNYMNNVRRLNAWQEIATNLNTTAEVCKKRWNQLRDNHRKSKANADKTTTGQAAGKKKIVKFEKEMSFLNDYIFEERQQQSNFTEESDIIEEETHADSHGDSIASNEDISPSHARSTPSPAPPSVGKMRTGRNPQKSAIAEYFKFKKELQEKKSCSDSNKQPSDHITKFFSSMEGTVRTLPLHLQVEAKSKISHIVHQLETQALYTMPSTSTGFTQPGVHGNQSYYDAGYQYQPNATNVPLRGQNQQQLDYCSNMPAAYGSNQPAHGPQINMNQPQTFGASASNLSGTGTENSEG